MKVLVTGNRGNLGTLVCKVLERHGHKVMGFDLKDQKNILNYQQLKNVMAKGVQCVVHTAGIPTPRNVPMERFFRTNVEGTFNVLRAASETGVRRVVFFSSTAYYGCDIRGQLCPAYFPIDEAHPIAAMPGYSEGQLEEYCQSKVMAEQLVAYYGTNRKVQTVALRIAPANKKSIQYQKGFDWRTDKSYIRGCFFSNCHPDYVAQAARLAVESEREFWYEPFNIADRYTHESVDVWAFLERDYPNATLVRDIGQHDCLFNTEKAKLMLGFEPCEDLR